MINVIAGPKQGRAEKRCILPPEGWYPNKPMNRVNCVRSTNLMSVTTKKKKNTYSRALRRTVTTLLLPAFIQVTQNKNHHLHHAFCLLTISDFNISSVIIFCIFIRADVAYVATTKRWSLKST